MHEVLVNRLGGLSLPRKSVVKLTDRPDMTLDVYSGRKTTTQQQQQQIHYIPLIDKRFLVNQFTHVCQVDSIILIKQMSLLVNQRVSGLLYFF